MHDTARAYVGRQARGRWRDVVEFGSRNINGTIRANVTHETWVGIDPNDGPDVDVVDDAAVWAPEHTDSADLVVCCEVFEHHPDPAELVNAAAVVLRPGGTFITTCATDPRSPHSGIHAGAVQAGEYYRNVRPDDLRRWCENAGFSVVDLDTSVRGDLYVTAVKEA